MDFLHRPVTRSNSDLRFSVWKKKFVTTDHSVGGKNIGNVEFVCGIEFIRRRRLQSRWKCRGRRRIFGGKYRGRRTRWRKSESDTIRHNKSFNSESKARNRVCQVVDTRQSERPPFLFFPIQIHSWIVSFDFRFMLGEPTPVPPVRPTPFSALAAAAAAYSAGLQQHSAPGPWAALSHYPGALFPTAGLPPGAFGGGLTGSSGKDYL